MSDQGWCTIESDPGVFTSLLTEIGVKNTQVEELYSLDSEQLSQFGKIYGLIFLFKYRKNEHSAALSRDGEVVTPPEGLFFAQQTIQNACATVALLQIVMNAKLELGEELTRFREFTNGMDPATVGLVLSNSEVIRGAHNSFSGQTQLVVENEPTTSEDAFHFVAYTPHGGLVYELDGLQQGPRRIGEDNGKWVNVAAEVIQKRIAEYGDSEIRFNIMAVVEDPRERLKKELEGSVSDGRRSVIEETLKAEEEKQRRWHVENVRRRWSFVPLVVEFCKVLAKAGVIEGLIDEVQEKKKSALKDQKEVEEVTK